MRRCPETVGKSGKPLACATAYNKYGCRCDECRAWEAERAAERYARYKEEGRCHKCGADIGYSLSSRCRECLAKHDMREYKRRLRKRIERSRARAVERWGEEGRREFGRRLRDAITQG